MRFWRPLILVLSLCIHFAARAEPVAAAPPRGSFECRDTPLRSALALLRAQSGLDIRLGEGVPNVAVSLALKDVAYEDILRVLVRQAAVTSPGLRVTRMAATYAVHRAPPQASGEPALPEPMAGPTLSAPFLRRISVGFRDEGLRETLGRVFQLGGAPISVEPDVPNFPITLAFRNGTVWECVRRILDAAQEQLPEGGGKLALGQIGEVYLVALRQPSGGDSPKEAGAAMERITLKLDGVPFKLAAEALFRGTSYQYRFNPDPGDQTVSLSLEEVPLEVALNRLGQEASRAGVRLTWTRN